jgi:outer membrane protein TolC
MKKTVIAFLALLIITVQAQEITRLTLKEINYALQNKADAKKAKLKVENEYEIQEIRSRALPQISANGSLTSTNYTNYGY